MSEIEDLDALEKGGAMESGINISNVYSVRLGGFGIDTSIKTYLTTLKVSELQADVSLYETLSNDKDWPVSQIIQREVDKTRINEITKKYLLGKGRDVKYFPPIIVALLPREVDGSFSKAYNFQSDQSSESKEIILDKSKFRNNDKFRTLLKSKSNDSNIEGLYFFNTSPLLDHNVMCWDKDKMYAVVIDGQHRLDSLISGQNTDPLFNSALQDVIFLDVSTLIESKLSLTPVQVLRTIFIDINTNAKSVTLVRKILMDDKDLASLCVQSIVESVNKDGSSKDTSEYLPSVLLDWYGESLKHELPHITGLLTLHQIISDELVPRRLNSIEDHRDLSKVKDFVAVLNDRFFVDYSIKKETDYNEITTLTDSFDNYLKEKDITREIFAQEVGDDSLDSILFTYDYRVLEVAQRNFEKFYLKSIIQIFEKTKPYERVINFLRSESAFEVNSNLYKALVSKTKKILSTPNLKASYIEAKRSLNSTYNNKYFLFYSVVGQKGVFRAFFEKLYSIFKLGSNEHTVFTTQIEYVKGLNSALDILDNHEFFLFGKSETFIEVSEELEEYGTVADSFWEGILFEDRRIIYNSQGVRAFADVIKFITVAFEKLKKGEDLDAMVDFPFRFSSIRTKRLLTKRFGERSELEWDRITDLILSNKKLFLSTKIKEAYLNAV